MKRWIITAFAVVAIGFTAEAQTKETKSKDKAERVKVTKVKKENKTVKKLNKKPSKVLNNRRIFHWKTGQRSTPTGREATPVGGGYASLKKDTATVVIKEKEQ